MARKVTEFWSAVCLPLFLGASFAALAQSGQAPAVSAPPAGANIPGTSDLRIEPQRGQNQQQEWSDRYACYEWARNQSGFDPGRAGGGVPEAEIALRRDQYRRAMTACLEGRGYSVREVAPSPPPAASAPPPVSAPRPRPRYSRRYVVTRPAPVREFRYHPFAIQVEGGYTVTTGSLAHSLENGWNAGIGFTLQPIQELPLVLRIDGSYSRFGQTRRSLNLASQTYGTNIDWGHQNLYGGDVDAQINLRMGPSVREYFFGGIGWYRQQTIFGQTTFERGIACWFYCFRAYFPVDSTVVRSTSGWMNSWNAGFGFEFALADPASFFIEARYLRLSPRRSNTAFVPIRFGLRF